MAEPINLFASSEGLDVAKPVDAVNLFAPDPNAPGPFKRGLKTGVADLKSIGGGLMQYAGRATGFGALENKGVEVQQNAATESEPYRMQVEDVGRAFDEGVGPGIGATADLVKYAVGNQIPMLATAALGGVIGRVAAAGLGTTKVAAGLGAVENAVAVAKAARAADLGTSLGVFGSSVAMEAGQIAPEAFETGVENPLLRTAGGALVAGALDTVLPVYLARKLGLIGAAERVLAPRAAGFGAIAKDVGGTALKAGGFEGVQEGAQTYIERLAAGQPLTGDEANSAALNSTVMGAILGLVTGGVAGGVHAVRSPVTIDNATGQPVETPTPAATPETGTIDPNLGTPADELPPVAPATPAEIHAQLTAAHQQVTQQVAALEPAVVQAQTEHDALVAKRDALTAETKLEIGNRRPKNEILTERKAVAKQIAAAKAKVEELGGSLNQARSAAAEITPQLEAATRLVAGEGDNVSGTIQDPGTVVPDVVVPAEGLNPAIAPKTDPLASTTIADPNAPVVPESEQITRAVTGVQRMMRDRGMLHDLPASKLASDATPRELAIERQGGRGSVKGPNSAQMAAVEEHAMTVIEPMAAELAKAKTDTPGGQAKIAKAMVSAMRSVVSEAAKLPSVEAAQQYITDKLPNALKGHGVVMDAPDMAKAVSAAVGQAKTQYSKGAVRTFNKLTPEDAENLSPAELDQAIAYYESRASLDARGTGYKTNADIMLDFLEDLRERKTQYSKGASESSLTKRQQKMIPALRDSIASYQRADGPTRASMLQHLPDADAKVVISRFGFTPEEEYRSIEGYWSPQWDRTGRGPKTAEARDQFIRQQMESAAPIDEQILSSTPRATVSESHAALTQDEFDTLPEPAKYAAVDEFNRVMMAKGTELRQRITQMLGPRAGLIVKTFMATPDSPIGSYTRVGPLKAVIAMALNAKDGLSIADHEGYHAAEDSVLTAAEVRIIANALKAGRPAYEQLMAKVRAYDLANKTNLADEVSGVPAEARAYAFEFWRRGELTAEGPLARVFQKLRQFFERVANAVRGLGFTSMEDIFVSLDRGQFAERESNSGQITENAGEFGMDGVAWAELHSQAAQSEYPKYQLSPSEELKRELASDPEKARQFAEWRKANDYWQAVQEGRAGNTQFSRAAVAQMNTRFANGELERVQEFNAWMKMQDDAMLHKNDTLKRVLFGPLAENMGGSISRWWQENIATPNYVAHLSQGFKNVYKTLNTYIRYRETLIEQMLRQQMPEWYTAHFADQDAAFGALLKRSVEKYTANSQEQADLYRTLTPEQQKLFDGATKMIAGFLDAELAVDTKDYKDYLVTPGAYEKWLADRTAQVQEMKDTGYVPLRRYGDHTVRVYKSIIDKEGKPQQLEVALEMFTTEREAIMASKIYDDEMKRQGSPYTVEVGFKHKTTRDTTVSVQQFLDTARRNGVNISATERERLVIALSDSGAMVRNRMLHREGMPGFSKDGMRVLNEFGVNMSGKIAYARFGVAIDSAADGRAVTSDVVNGEPQIEIDQLRYSEDGKNEAASEYEARNLWEQDGPKSGFYRNMADKLSDYVLVPDNTGGWSRNLRGAAMMYFIGGSISGAMVNTMSVPMLLVPELSIHTPYMNAAATSLGAWKTVWRHQAILRDITRLKDVAANPMPSIDNVPGLRDAIIAATDKLHDTELHSIMSISQGQFFSQSRKVQRAIEVWMAPFRISEQTNRITSFISGFKIGRENGLSGPALFNFARDMVDSTQNSYSQANRPGAARNPIFAIAMVFKSFPLFMTEAIALMYKQNPKSAVYMLLGLVALTGVQGLPFAETIEDLIDTIAQRIFNSPFNTRRAMRNVIKSASEAVVGYDMSELVLRGVINDMVGMSVSSRIGAGDFVPGTRLGTADADQGRIFEALAGAPVAMLKDGISNIGKLATGIATGDWQRAAQALREGGPVAIRNAIKGSEQLADGYASDSKGRKIVDISTPAALWQMAGVASADLAKMYELESINVQTKAFYQQASQEMQNQLVRALKAGDTEKVQEISELRSAWNAQYPEMPIMANAASVRRALVLAGVGLDQRSRMLWGRRLGGANIFTEGQ